MADIEDRIESTEIKLEAFKKAFIYLMWKMRVKRRISHYLTRKLILKGESKKLINILKELHQDIPVIDRNDRHRIRKDSNEIWEMLPKNFNYQIPIALCNDYELLATYLIGDKNDQHNSAISYEKEDISSLIRHFLEIYTSIRVDYFFFK